MRKLGIGTLAAAGVALLVPANAQGVWVGAGPRGGYHDGYYGPGYHSYAYADDDFAYVGVVIAGSSETSTGAGGLSGAAGKSRARMTRKGPQTSVWGLRVWHRNELFAAIAAKAQSAN
jgi:hypothetical protein